MRHDVAPLELGLIIYVLIHNDIYATYVLTYVCLCLYTVPNGLPPLYNIYLFIYFVSVVVLALRKLKVICVQNLIRGAPRVESNFNWLVPPLELNNFYVQLIRSKLTLFASA